MSKYAPLRDYLYRQFGAEFVLTFKDVERIIGAPLPTSADRPQWWANTKAQSTHVQREAWRAAGYDAFLVAGSQKVKFRRVC